MQFQTIFVICIEQPNVLNIMGIGERERFPHVAMRIEGLSQQRTGNGTSGKLNQFGIKIDKNRQSLNRYLLQRKLLSTIP